MFYQYACDFSGFYQDSDFSLKKKKKETSKLFIIGILVDRCEGASGRDSRKMQMW